MSDKENSLTVLWTSGDREVALHMVFMYVFNAKKRGWWEDIKLIVWGPSQKLATKDEQVKEGLEELREAGVNLEACVVCAEQYGVVSDLEGLGIEVYGMGEPLTEDIKKGTKVLTL